jgi:V/A-type H+-transporting ATPase subunit A
VGPDARPGEQRLILETARLLREGFLQQNALDEVDAYSNVQKQIHMLSLILHFHQRAQRIIKRGAHIAVIHDLPVVNTLIRMKESVPNDALNKLDDIRREINEEMDQLELEYQ